MRITTKAKEFIRCVNLLKSVVPTRSPMPAIMGILIKTDMTMIANNMRSGISVTLVGEQSLEGYLGDPLSWILPGRKVIDICSKIKVDNDTVVTLDLSDDQKATLKVGRSRFTLKTLPGEQFPAFPDVPDTEKHYIPGADLVSVLKNTVYAVSSDQSEVYLCGVYLKGLDGQLRAMATDKKRFAVVSVPYDQEFDGVVIPTEFVRIMISAVEEGDVWFTVADNQIVCGQGDTILTALLYAEVFPEEQVVAMIDMVNAYSSHLVCSKADLANAIDTALVLSNPLVANRIMLNASDSSIYVSTGHEAEGAVNVVEAELTGPMEPTYLNGVFVKNVLATLDDTITIKHGGKSQPVLVRSGGVYGIIQPHVVKEETV